MTEMIMIGGWILFAPSESPVLTHTHMAINRMLQHVLCNLASACICMQASSRFLRSKVFLACLQSVLAASILSKLIVSIFTDLIAI